MFVEAVEALLAERCSGAQVRAIEQGDAGARQALWAALEEGGFLELLAPEAAGGAALPLSEALPVLLTLGRFAMPLPVAQTVFARALLLPHGLAVPAGPIALGIAVRGGGLGAGAPDGGPGCPLLPFGRYAEHVIADDAGDLCLLDARDAAREGTGVHGSGRATLRFAARSAEVARVRGAGAAVGVAAAACHAALLAGAMQRCLDLTVQYAGQRVQFGQPIARYQAVQHQLAVMAEEVVAARMAVASAFSGSGPLPEPLRVAVAKARASEAADVVAATSHALHGAIGITAEYDLQLFTRRLHDWRMADGSEQHWHRRLGEALLEGEEGVAGLVRALSA